MKKKIIASTLLLLFICFSTNSAVFAAPGHGGPNHDRGRIERPVYHQAQPHHQKAPQRPVAHTAHHNVPPTHANVHVQNNYYDGCYDNGYRGVGIAATILGVLAIGAGITAIATN